MCTLYIEQCTVLSRSAEGLVLLLSEIEIWICKKYNFWGSLWNVDVSFFMGIHEANVLSGGKTVHVVFPEGVGVGQAG